ncbi:MAG: WYL domain-containing protein [Nanoarchaeota archaeon]|nr:WYL domain-containing protein [Nanoarchaeota archaeon]MBU1103427.1 WYL domain-containing protein [Nanoarchaeota archaeon]
MDKNGKAVNFSEEELEALYKILKGYEKNAPESDKEYYDDYYDEYKTPIKKKIIKSIYSKVNNFLPKEEKEEIDKEFLREKYHTFNNDIDERVYSAIERAFSQLKTVEIKYFNMQSAEFSKRKIDVYYRSRRYIIGYCHLKKGIRKFRTSRIASARLTNETYEIPGDFDKNKY